MNLVGYYKKLRDLERTVPGKDVYVVSLATPEGGKEGVISHVARRVGCQLVLDSRARFATAEEIESFEKEQEARRVEFEQKAALNRIQVQLLPEVKERLLKGPLGTKG